MEFRRSPFFRIFSLSPSLFTEESQLYSLQGEKSFTAQLQDRVWVHSVFWTLDTGNCLRSLKRPPREAEPHLHRVSTLRNCVWCYTSTFTYVLRRSVKERAWIFFLTVRSCDWNCGFILLWFFHLPNLQRTWFKLGLKYNLFIANKCTYSYLTMINVIILDTVIFNLFKHTYYVLWKKWTDYHQHMFQEA